MSCLNHAKEILKILFKKINNNAEKDVIHEALYKLIKNQSLPDNVLFPINSQEVLLTERKHPGPYDFSKMVFIGDVIDDTLTSRPDNETLNTTSSTEGDSSSVKV